jgi:hypothetical protein
MLCSTSLKSKERGGTMKRKANKKDILAVQHYLGAEESS